jgi:hypothetical protein
MKSKLFAITALSVVLFSGLASTVRAEGFSFSAIKDIKGAFDKGVEIGEGIEKYTGAGSKAGDYIYQNSNRRTAGEAVDKLDAARNDWKKGNYGTAVTEGAQGAGKIFQGFINW